MHAAATGWLESRRRRRIRRVGGCHTWCRRMSSNLAACRGRHRSTGDKRNQSIGQRARDADNGIGATAENHDNWAWLFNLNPDRIAREAFEHGASNNVLKGPVVGA